MYLVNTNMGVNSSEEWRDVVGYEDIYHVSNEGRVRRVLQSRGTRPDLLKPSVNPKNGYHSVMLWSQNKGKRITVHRLVALAFLGEQPGLEVCHNNDDRDNNSVSNLRWDTHSQNHLDIARNGNRPTHCKLGHEYTPENSYLTKRGYKECNTCRKRRQKARRK